MCREEQMLKSLLYTIYMAGYNHGNNSGVIPKIGTLEAFNRLIIGESPEEDGHSYDIKDDVSDLFSKISKP